MSSIIWEIKNADWHVTLFSDGEVHAIHTSGFEVVLTIYQARSLTGLLELIPKQS